MIYPDTSTSGREISTMTPTIVRRLPHHLYKTVILKPRKRCPHCGEFLEKDTNPKYVTFIWNQKEEERKAWFLKINYYLDQGRQ